MDKLKFASINKDGSNRVNILEKKTDQYVKFGQYNSFPNDLIELYNNSSIHNTCIECAKRSSLQKTFSCIVWGSIKCRYC